MDIDPSRFGEMDAIGEQIRALGKGEDPFEALKNKKAELENQLKDLLGSRTEVNADNVSILLRNTLVKQTKAEALRAPEPRFSQLFLSDFRKMEPNDFKTIMQEQILNAMPEDIAFVVNAVKTERAVHKTMEKIGEEETKGTEETNETVKEEVVVEQPPTFILGQSSMLAEIEEHIGELDIPALKDRKIEFVETTAEQMEQLTEAFVEVLELELEMMEQESKTEEKQTDKTHLSSIETPKDEVQEKSIPIRNKMRQQYVRSRTEHVKTETFRGVDSKETEHRKEMDKDMAFILKTEQLVRNQEERLARIKSG